MIELIFCFVSLFNLWTELCNNYIINGIVLFIASRGEKVKSDNRKYCATARFRLEA